MTHQPCNAPLRIHSDSQAALAIAHRCPRMSVRAALKQPDNVLRAVLHTVLDQRSAPTEFAWVRGHAGDAMNERADRLANQARADSPALLPPVVITGHNQFFLAHRGSPIPIYGRWFLKHLSRHANDLVFLGCRQGVVLTSLPPAELAVTIAALKSVDPSESRLFTSQGNSCFRAFRYKFLMGLSPTALRMAIWRPDLYRSPDCPRCLQGPETLSHILVCPSNEIVNFSAAFSELLTETMPRPFMAFARPLADFLLRNGLDYTTFTGAMTPEAYRVLDELPFPVPTAVLATATLRALWIFVYEHIWKPRCSSTVRLERQRGVTARMQRAPPEARATAEVLGPTELIPPVLEAAAHTSPAFGRSATMDASLWQQALRSFMPQL